MDLVRVGRGLDGAKPHDIGAAGAAGEAVPRDTDLPFSVRLAAQSTEPYRELPACDGDDHINAARGCHAGLVGADRPRCVVVVDAKSCGREA